MTNVERQILANQVAIISALALLVSNPMKDSILKIVETTIELIHESDEHD